MTQIDFHELITGNSEGAVCVWWFNVDLDIDWDRQKSRFFPYVESSDKTAVYGMEQIMLMMADESDIVIMRRRPDESICGNIKRIRNGLPEILTPSDDSMNLKSMSEVILSDEKLLAAIGGIAKKAKTYLVPYAITEHEAKIAELTGAELFGPPYGLASQVNSKIAARNISKKLDFATTFGMECHSKNDLYAAYDMIQNKYPGSAMVLKEEYGASGKGLFLIKGKQDWDMVAHRAGKLEKSGAKFNAILEKWHSVKENINYQLIITDNTYMQKNYLFSLSRQNVNDGVYKGSVFIKNNSQLYSSYEPYATILGDYLYSKGYRGICNSDSIITNDDGIVPIVEINGRLSLSTYISCAPHMFSQDMIVASAYYDIDSGIKLDEINDAVNKSKKGIFVYSFSAGAKRSRLFALFAFPSEAEINESKFEFEIILDLLNLKHIRR